MFVQNLTVQVFSYPALAMVLMAEEAEEECNHINDLPDDLLIHILSFLTIKEMRQTSALSRRWRPLWRLVHNLSISIDESLTKGHQKVSASRIARRANQILFHDGLNVVKVRKFGLRFSYRREILQIYEWIDFATSRGVEELNLIFLGRSAGIPEIPLPPSVFVCESLRAMSLMRCVVNPSHGGVNLASLKTLSLSRVTITDDGLQTLSLNTPLLENLSLTRCDSLRHLKLSPLKKLNRLALYEADHLNKVEIDGRNLRCLEFQGSISICEFISFGAVGSTLSTSTGSLRLKGVFKGEEEEESRLVQQSLYCPLLETLSLHYDQRTIWLQIFSLPLKNLWLYGCTYARGIDIEAPSLRFFKYELKWAQEGGPQVRLINSPSLQQAILGGYNIKDHILTFAHVSDLRITIATSVLKGLIKNNGARSIRNIRHLNMIFKDMILESDLIFVLQSCPQLESLSCRKIPQYEFQLEAHIRCMCHKEDEENHSSDCWKFRLKKVKMLTFEGRDFQMQTINFLLNEAENLESMEISMGGLGEVVELQDSFITNDLICYMRSSTRAEDCSFSLDEGKKMLTFNWTL